MKHSAQLQSPRASRHVKQQSSCSQQQQQAVRSPPNKPLTYWIGSDSNGKKMREYAARARRKAKPPSTIQSTPIQSKPIQSIQIQPNQSKSNPIQYEREGFDDRDVSESGSSIAEGERCCSHHKRSSHRQCGQSLLGRRACLYWIGLDEIEESKEKTKVHREDEAQVQSNTIQFNATQTSALGSKKSPLQNNDKQTTKKRSESKMDIEAANLFQTNANSIFYPNPIQSNQTAGRQASMRTGYPIQDQKRPWRCRRRAWSGHSSAESPPVEWQASPPATPSL